MTTHEPRPPVPATGNFLTREQMRAAQKKGLVRPLSPAIVDFVRYQDCWWIAHPDGWVLVDDPAVASRLDRQHAWTTIDLFSDG